MTEFQPYRNEKDSFDISELTVENRIDCVEIYGSIRLTKDKVGLLLARQLKQLVDSTLAVLEKDELPDQVPVAKTDRIKNPF